MNLNPNEYGVARTHTCFRFNATGVKWPPNIRGASMKPQPDGHVSLLRVKAAARNLLPDDSLTRRVILDEADTLPLEEALAKFAVFDRLLVAELGSASRRA